MTTTAIRDCVRGGATPVIVDEPEFNIELIPRIQPLLDPPDTKTLVNDKAVVLGDQTEYMRIEKTKVSDLGSIEELSNRRFPRPCFLYFGLETGTGAPATTTGFAVYRTVAAVWRAILKRAISRSDKFLYVRKSIVGDLSGYAAIPRAILAGMPVHGQRLYEIVGQLIFYLWMPIISTTVSVVTPGITAQTLSPKASRAPTLTANPFRATSEF